MVGQRKGGEVQRDLPSLYWQVMVMLLEMCRMTEGLERDKLWSIVKDLSERK